MTDVADHRAVDAGGFLHSIAGCHYIMVYGDFTSEVSSELMRMNVSSIGPTAAYPARSRPGRSRPPRGAAGSKGVRTVSQ